MLSDQDRIFTNLYGFHSAGLDAARKRGAWDGTHNSCCNRAATGSSRR